jgi:hypothetical protein
MTFLKFLTSKFSNLERCNTFLQKAILVPITAHPPTRETCQRAAEEESDDQTVDQGPALRSMVIPHPRPPTVGIIPSALIVRSSLPPLTFGPPLPITSPRPQVSMSIPLQ